MLVEQGRISDSLEHLVLGLQVLTGAALKQRCCPILCNTRMLVQFIFVILAL
jgi:hypothetical protein